jgi:hypothetical protein
MLSPCLKVRSRIPPMYRFFVPFKFGQLETFWSDDAAPATLVLAPLSGIKDKKILFLDLYQPNFSPNWTSLPSSAIGGDRRLARGILSSIKFTVEHQAFVGPFLLTDRLNAEFVRYRPGPELDLFEHGTASLDEQGRLSGGR